MKSESIEFHFNTLEQQREILFPTVESLTMNQLWERPSDGKWSIGESIYHLYLMMKVLRVAAVITIPCTKLYAKSVRRKLYATSIHDIYQEYGNKRKKSMKAPFVLNPPNNIRLNLTFDDVNALLVNETRRVKKLVEEIDEDIAGHIIFLDPVANYPNLIQAIQLLAIHEAHHFRIMKRDLEESK
ncbi:hypothetical protein CEW92_06735 [Bacillaceae bacterium SAS-127]|nr:hypothetical protein CEW92_06735 [Bacillaceae bacterium SAS-127]